MSASNEWTEWHLTPNGWVRGSEKIDFGKPDIKDPPVDRVMTYTWREHLSSVFSKPSLTVEGCKYFADSKTISDLQAKFGEGPRHL